ncbi:benenodin family lasso peptide [Caulobacter soli]|nr:benenodin family lasso peptide [Caulobacter soli]
MDRFNDEDPIDLGAASVETKGPLEGHVEFGGRQPITGLAED